MTNVINIGSKRQNKIESEKKLSEFWERPDVQALQDQIANLMLEMFYLVPEEIECDSIVCRAGFLDENCIHGWECYFEPERSAESNCVRKVPIFRKVEDKKE